MRRYILLISCLLTAGSMLAQIVPEERTVDWSVAGQNADFADPSQKVNVMDFGASGNGTTNDAPAIQSAIESLGGEPGIVNFPAGSYLIEEPISLPSGVVMQGVDTVSTEILIDFGGEPKNAINISGAATTDFQPVESGYNEGSTSVIVEDGSVFNEGNYAELLENNGEWNTEPISWAENSVGQILKIISVEGNTLTFENPLRIDYQENLNPRIRRINPAKNIAVENLKIERLDEPEEGAGSNIDINLAANVRIKDIESDKSVGSHINVHRSSQVWLTGSYIHHAFTYDGTGTRGYGIALHMHTGECLIDNNVFKHLRHAMMVKTGANGNVFAYNYSIDPFRSETYSDLTGDISLHGHYAFSNLFEGNIVQNIFIDHYWGASGPYNTFFRNRIELYGFAITDYESPTDKQNIVGLEITNTDYGYYRLQGEEHFQYGNNIKGNFQPSDTDSLPDSSYYLNQKPGFWNINDPWPSIGVPVEYNTWSIPAKERYLGNTTGYQEIGISNIKVYPNPFTSYFMIEMQGGATELFEVIVRNVLGEQMLKTKVHPGEPIETSKLSPGIYLLTVKAKETNWTVKAVKSR